MRKLNRTPEYHWQDYKESLDLTASIRGHSMRETQPRGRWLMFGDIALATEVKNRQSRYGKPSSAEFDELLRAVNNRCIEFLHVDLDLALTMAKIAADADGNAARRERNTRNARKAYEAVLWLRHKVNATAAQKHHLDRKLTHLHMLLADLGEQFQSLPFAA
jgi:hypothetical protein